LVEAQNFALSKWAPGAEEASGATGYFGSSWSLEAGFCFGERESEKGGDGARLAFEEIGRARAGRLFWLWTLIQERPAPANRYSTTSLGGTADRPIPREIARGQLKMEKHPNEEDRHHCRTGADGTGGIAHG
jgi:hypothetical protein